MTGDTTSTTVVAVDRVELAAGRDRLAGRVAVVMTMGALHDGHVALIRQARDLAESVVVTVFLNPLQFAPGEDLSRYPRTLDADLELCAREGVELVFTPGPDVVYPDGDPQVTVSAGPLGSRLEGASRPGHFDGVLTVVAKLLHLVRPDVAMFGEKDAQQLALIAAMVRDLDVPVEVVGVPTVRDPDGLALSSRNRYLGDGDRWAALALSTALRMGADRAEGGPGAVLAAAAAVLADSPDVGLDYLELVDASTWEPADDRTRTARLLVAAKVGSTRLIDNVTLELGGGSACS